MRLKGNTLKLIIGNQEKQFGLNSGQVDIQIKLVSNGMYFSLILEAYLR